MKRLVAAGVLGTLIITGCSSVTQGSGQARQARTTSHSADFPSTSASQSSSAASSTTATAPTTSPSAITGPTRQQREDRLTAQSNGEAHVLVAVPGGFEAATYDRVGGIQFWRSVGRAVDWTRTGGSRYPDEVDGRPYQVAVSGARLRGMVHATFIVKGQFTADNSGLAVAYTTGPKGWGAIKAEPSGNIGPSGQPVGADRIGLSLNFGFVSGRLQTQDCPLNQPIANCGANPVTKLWAWTGADFRRV